MIGHHSSRTLAIAASAVMAAAVIAGLVVLGSPSHQRSLQLDQRRVTELNSLRVLITMYWQQHHTLPPNWEAIDLPPKARRDPVTREPYGYAVTGERSYRLCARFDLPSDPDATSQPWLGNRWNHPAGQHCVDWVVGSP